MACKCRGGFFQGRIAALGSGKHRLRVLQLVLQLDLRLPGLFLCRPPAAFQLLDAVVQWLHRGRQGQVVGRHGPAQFHFQHAAFGRAGGQDFSGNGQPEPGIVARQQQQACARSGRQRRLPDDLAVWRVRQQRAGRRGRRPVPQRCATGAAQRDAVEVQKTGPVGRVQAQLGQRCVQRWQGKAQRLALLANGAGGGELAVFRITVLYAQIQLRCEAGLGGFVLCFWKGRLQHSRLRHGLCHGDELVGQCVGCAQEVSRHRGRQAVESHLKFGVGQFAPHGVQAVQRPALLCQKAGQRAARKKPQVRAVQQAFLPVAEFTLHQFGQQAAVGSIGHGNQQPATRRQQGMAGVQHALGAGQVFQHIGADDEVVTLAGKGGAQVARLQVVHHHAPVMRAGVRGLGLAEGDSIAGAAACFSQVLAQCTAAAAQVKHCAVRCHQAGEHRQGGAFTVPDAAQIYV